MPVEVWSAHGHFVPLTMRVVKFSSLLLKDFLLSWFRKSFEEGRSWGY